jgi:hypothetical protein
MNMDEAIVDKYLRSLEIGDVMFEPDGKLPPDFLVDTRIAVEARRLNQHYEDAGKLRGLEQDTIPLRQRLENLLTEFTQPGTQSWFVMFSFRRPFAEWSILKPKLRGCLASVLAQRPDSIWRMEIDQTFNISILRATTVEGSNFLLGGYTDMDAGGWVVSEVVRNMSAYVAEKNKKVAPYLKKYGEWWLVFVDYIGQESEAPEVKKYISRTDPWDKILVLNPMSGRAYEI